MLTAEDVVCASTAAHAAGARRRGASPPVFGRTAFGGVGGSVADRFGVGGSSSLRSSGRIPGHCVAVRAQEIRL
jgi:hypothetical protein